MVVIDILGDCFLDFICFIMLNTHHYLKYECTSTMKKHPVGNLNILGDVLLKRPKYSMQDQQDHQNYGFTTQRTEQSLLPMLLQPV